MAIECLSTKLYVPPVRLNVMPRPRLFDRLDPTTAIRLVLVSAAAGYGKTTLISSWLAEKKCPVGWLSLDENDNDPVRFLQYLIRALEPSIAGIELELPGLLQEMPSDALMNPLLSVIARQTG